MQGNSLEASAVMEILGKACVLDEKCSKGSYALPGVSNPSPNQIFQRK